MNLSKNFTLNEFQYSHTADRLGINNTAPPEAVERLWKTAAVLQVIRNALSEYFEEDVAIHISSGYRCKALNKAIGGAKDSAHLLGYAADINAEDVHPEELVRFCIDQGIKFDQIINEYDKWVHISFHPDMRGQVLQATRNKNGTTTYTHIV